MENEPLVQSEKQSKREELEIDNAERLLAAVFGLSVIVAPEFKDEFKENLTEVLETLTERERRVLSLRFGLYDGISRTLKEVGEIDGNYLRGKPYHRERMRQIEAKALRKLRRPNRSKFLKPFVLLEEDSLANRIWGVKCEYQLAKRFSSLNFESLNLEDLDLSERTLNELFDNSGPEWFGKPYFLKSITAFSAILGEPAAALSEETCLEIKRALERLKAENLK